MNKLLVFAMTSAIASNAFAYSGSNDPKFFDAEGVYNHKLSSLPMSGNLSAYMAPWASSFWPHIYGGIAFRWNDSIEDAPVVRKLQAQISGLKDEYIALKKELFAKANPSDREVTITGNKIQDAKNEIKELLSLKGAEHQKVFFDIKRPENLDDVRKMSQDQINKLSPTEKYDIYVALKTGKSNNFRLTNEVLGVTGPYKAYWEGICNGWSSAAIEYYEPQVQSYSKNGITVTFGSSDMKALLSYYHFAITKNKITSKKSRTNRIGERCKTEFPEEAWFMKDGKEFYKTVENNKIVVKSVPEECVDTNPGAFHIALANKIAIEKEGFVAEVVRDKEIWNQPVFGYKSEIVSERTSNFVNPTKKTRKQVKVKTRMDYANDGGRMFWEQDDPEEEFYAWWEPTNGTPNYRGGHKDFEYILDLDKKGNIIGGHWLSYERPDFIWVKRSKGFIGTGFLYGIVGYLNDLKDLAKVR
jgi:hypothetical protein